MPPRIIQLQISQALKERCQGKSERIPGTDSNPIYVKIAHTMISDSLLAAFLNAHYVVFTQDTSFTLRIGQRSTPLVQLMQDHGRDTATVLTAFNPRAKQASAETNRNAQQSLLWEAQALGLPCFDGENIAANRDGPSEPTVVVLGINRYRARSLARKFRQLAFVHSEAHGIPELVWLCEP